MDDAPILSPSNAACQTSLLVQVPSAPPPGQGSAPSASSFFLSYIQYFMPTSPLFLLHPHLPPITPQVDPPILVIAQDHPPRQPL